MKFTGCIILVALFLSCSTVERQNTAHRDERKSPKAVSLPKLSLESVNFDDGVQRHEAVALSSEYFSRFVGFCGMPDEPQDQGRFWRVQLWGGIVGSTDCGRLWLAKDGSEVLLEPPKRGFQSVTLELLKYHKVIQE